MDKLENYWTDFKITALAEAREIDLYLRTLEKHFQGLEEIDFMECQPLFRPLFHVICMIWRDSKYYCNSSKLIVLLKQISNLLIYQVILEFLTNCNSFVSLLQLLSIELVKNVV